jgi:hypothetical protein
MSLPKKKKASYTAVVLDEKSRSLLLETFVTEIASLEDDFQFKTERNEPLIHHVTVNLGCFDPILNENLLGQEITMEVISFAYDSKVAAFGIKTELSGYGGSKFGSPSVYSVNQIPHITVAINPKENGSPYDSNKLKEWKSTHKSVEIRGIFREVE